MVSSISSNLNIEFEKAFDTIWLKALIYKLEGETEKKNKLSSKSRLTGKKYKKDIGRDRDHDRDRKTFIRSLEELDQRVLLYPEFRNTNACNTNIDTKKEYPAPERP